jgi:hypothetical protein
MAEEWWEEKVTVAGEDIVLMLLIGSGVALVLLLVVCYLVLKLAKTQKIGRELATQQLVAAPTIGDNVNSTEYDNGSPRADLNASFKLAANAQQPVQHSRWRWPDEFTGSEFESLPPIRLTGKHSTSHEPFHTQEKLGMTNLTIAAMPGPPCHAWKKTQHPPRPTDSICQAVQLAKSQLDTAIPFDCLAKTLTLDFSPDNRNGSNAESRVKEKTTGFSSHSRPNPHQPRVKTRVNSTNSNAGGIEARFGESDQHRRWRRAQLTAFYEKHDFSKLGMVPGTQVGLCCFVVVECSGEQVRQL